MEMDRCIREDEKLDELFDGRIRVIQKKTGYRFSLDAVLLAHFAARIPAASIIDLGTGSGIVPLILARKQANTTIVGVELQPGLADMARRTIALNGLADRVSIVQDDLREISRGFTPSSFDLVVSNPPYYPVVNGRINPDEEKAIARHEIMATVQDIIKVSSYLTSSAGTVLIIFPAKRLMDLLTAFMTSGLKPRALRIIYSQMNGEAKLVMAEGCKTGNPELEIAEPFIIYGADGEYSEEMKRIYQGL
jgi:tRNA1Val (adenine37-N6)-methyltransferase